MLSKISQVGSSIGVIIPKHIAIEGGFTKGTPVDIKYSDGQITITKRQGRRHGWAEAFAKYTVDGEDCILLPDHLDAEAIILL